ncbi:MAG: cellulase family glycosylhydrolase [Oscillospiraceae bacterium]|jgi:endoglucanase|nr:cellulase family glycosylhydrolase [Oscillospiraceae bacterium]
MKLKKRLLSLITAFALSMSAVSALPQMITPVGAAENVVYGDVDGDGDIGKMSDITLLSKSLAGNIKLSADASANANCDVTDGNTVVDSADLTAIVNYLLGDLTTLPYPELPQTNLAPVLDLSTVDVYIGVDATGIAVADEDNGSLTVSVEDESIVSAVFNPTNEILYIGGLTLGSSLVTVTDSEGLSAELTVNVVKPPVPVVPTIPGEIRDMSTAAFVAEMHAGWNLGNTFDAWNDTAGSDQKDYQQAFEGNASETSWGNPLTTKAMFETVKAQGFDFVRIPTTWHTHFIDENFTIDPEWMARVQTVVNYAIECDLKVILNTHHEGSVLIPTAEFENYDKEWIVTVWNQIGETFKDYGDVLMFEGLNEPRTEGSQYEWNGGTSNDRAVVNRLNQTFVDTIRAQGGNNATRFLLVPSYAAGVDNSLLPTYGAEQSGTHFEMPNDPANHTIAEIHAYTPWNFAGGGIEEGQYDQVFDDADKAAIDSMINQIKTCLIDKGYSVVLDEFGTRSTQQENNITVERPYSGTSRIDWLDYYVGKTRAIGVPCCVWDDGGWFRQLNRSNLSWYYPEYMDKFIEKSFA